jgi:hypothetical protein
LPPFIDQQRENNDNQLIIVESFFEVAVNSTRHGSRHAATGTANAEDGTVNTDGRMFFQPGGGYEKKNDGKEGIETYLPTRFEPLAHD